MPLRYLPHLSHLPRASAALALLVAAASLLLTLLAGCETSRVTAQGTASAVATVPIPATFAPSRPPTTLQNAWGKVAIHTLPSALADNRVFVFENAATPDGQWLIGANEPRDFIKNTKRLSYAVLYNIATRKMVTIRALLHPKSQIIAASADDHWVVWSEADDQPNFFNWVLFAYDRQSGVTRQLAQAALVNGRPPSGPSPQPIVDHGRVIWGQALGPVSPNTLSNAVAQMADLTTGQVTTLATKAGNPHLAWPWVSWNQITSGSNGLVVLKNLETGQSAQLLAQPSGFALVGTSLAYDDVTSVYLVDNFPQNANHGRTLATALNEADHLQFVTLNDRLVAWSQDSVTQVYDRAEQRLVVLPVTDGQSDSWVGGRTLVWLQPESKTQQAKDVKSGLIPAPTFKVIDTTMLPILTAP
jgi:hypothetical protein